MKALVIMVVASSICGALIYLSAEYLSPFCTMATFFASMGGMGFVAAKLK